jgi:hypothetical protein
VEGGYYDRSKYVSPSDIPNYVEHRTANSSYEDSYNNSRQDQYFPTDRDYRSHHLKNSRETYNDNYEKRNYRANQDYFIAEKMEGKNLSPNDEANKDALIKRAYADLIGLPPSYEELNKWRDNNSNQWYDQMIDQLLQKPGYGEKLGLLWMDLARYADSYGFQDDNIRSQWPWRDWVIHALNKNMPYDQFITQQIAGDLLPNASKENILATAFFRNHKYTEEGGVIEEEYRVSYNIDKTRTYGKAILGVTIECAQCHDHKYDPFSNKDYYQLYAFFNESREKGYEVHLLYF